MNWDAYTNRLGGWCQVLRLTQYLMAWQKNDSLSKICTSTKTKTMPRTKAKSTFNGGFEPKQPSDQLRLIILENGTEVARTTMRNLQRDLDWFRRNNPDKHYKHVCTAVLQYGDCGSKYQQ